MLPRCQHEPSVGDLPQTPPEALLASDLDLNGPIALPPEPVCQGHASLLGARELCDVRVVVQLCRCRQLALDVRE
ncbi:hypothetical protein GCM10012320_14610 [Sinomonas cellulolyticus]|nr:hypothetical protein GCM10012320_14610 [Sinomonas sp. KCTC 49339]